MTRSGSLQPTSAGVPRTPPDISGAPEPRHAHSPTLADAAGRLARGELTVDEFWRTTGLRRPLVEPDPADPSARIVTFLWRDPDAEHVYVGVNKVTHGPEQGAMTRLAGTDIWYLSVVLDARWRGTYGFVPLDADSWRDLVDTGARPAIRLLRESTVPDPGNPLVELSHLGDPLSVAELDLAPAQPWLTAPGGAGRSVRRPPEPVQGPADRTLWVTTPPDYGAEHAPDAPVLLVLDGEVWLRRGHVLDSVAALAATGRIRPPVVVHVDNGPPERRLTELSIDSGMADELALEIVPWLRSRHPVSARPTDVLVVGQSLGGLTALKTLIDHSHTVGAAIAQSSSLWQDGMIERLRASGPGERRLWLEVGTREPVLMEPHRRLYDELASGPVEVVAYVEFEGGHDAACWRGGIGDALAVLLAHD